MRKYYLRGLLCIFGMVLCCSCKKNDAKYEQESTMVPEQNQYENDSTDNCDEGWDDNVICTLVPYESEEPVRETESSNVTTKEPQTSQATKTPQTSQATKTPQPQQATKAPKTSQTAKPSSKSGTIPDSLKEISREDTLKSGKQGKIEKLTYDTWEAYSYEKKSQKLTKTAYVYVPYGYSSSQKYNIFYLSHGMTCTEATYMGTDTYARSFKNVIDNAMADGRMKPMILVMLTYNNTSSTDSSDMTKCSYLTEHYQNELLNDLIPAVEGKYSTYADNTTLEGIKNSRDHRGFGGFSMGSIHTWCTFRQCLSYFRYFMPMCCPSYSANASQLAKSVTSQGYGKDDFFIFSAAGTNDFSHNDMQKQFDAMEKDSSGMFKTGHSESEGNMIFFSKQGYNHDGQSMDEFTYNALCFFWNEK